MSIGRIINIVGRELRVELDVDINDAGIIVGKYVIISDSNKEFLGEILSLEKTQVLILLHGEVINNEFKAGVINKPSFNARIRMLRLDELKLLTSTNKDSICVNFGNMLLYDNTSVSVDLNEFFSNHFAIFGNTGSGKSCSVSRIMQNIFSGEKIPYMANIFMFDAYGEYTSAFTELNKMDPYVNFKVYTTNTERVEDEFTSLVRIPLWFLGVDDIALLLGATTVSQLPIIEKALKLVTVFSKNDEITIKHKNNTHS